MSDVSTKSRFANLGKLSIALLEHTVKPIIGEKAIDEIKSPVVEKDLINSLETVLEKAEKRFISEYRDKEICEIVLNLPLSDLPSVIQAVRAFYARPNDPALGQVLSEQLKSNFHNLPSERIDSGVSAYIKFLRDEFANLNGDVRERLTVRATLTIQDNTTRMADTLDQIRELMTVDKTGNSRSLFPHIVSLQKDLRERKNLKTLSEAVYQAEAMYAEGELPDELTDLLHSARNAFDEIRQRDGALTSKSRMGNLVARAEAVRELVQKIIAGEMYFYDATSGLIVPISNSLREANELYWSLSAETTEHEIEKAEKALSQYPFQAIAILREALKLPLCENDKRLVMEKIVYAEKVVNEQKQRVSNFIEKELTAQEREVIKLTTADDLTPNQIAMKLNMSTVIVNIQVDKVRQKLQTHFGLEHANLMTLNTMLGSYWQKVE